jgi:hypothetical protein
VARVPVPQGESRLKAPAKAPRKADRRQIRVCNRGRVGRGGYAAARSIRGLTENTGLAAIPQLEGGWLVVIESAQLRRELPVVLNQPRADVAGCSS